MLQKHYPNSHQEDYLQSYNALAIAYTDKKVYSKALFYLQNAQALYQQFPDTKGMETTWHNLSHIYRMTAKYDQALTYLNKSLEIYLQKEARHRVNIGKAYRHIGDIFDKQGKLEESLRYYQKSFSFLVHDFSSENVLTNPPLLGIRSNLDLLLSLRDKGKVLQKIGSDKKDNSFLQASLETFRIATALLDSMKVEYQEGSKLFWNEDARPVYEGGLETAFLLYDKTQEISLISQAFEFAEKSKAALLTEALRESAAKLQAGIPKEILKREKDLKVDIAFYRKLVFQEEQKGDRTDNQKILSWKSKMLKLSQEKEKLLAELEAKYPVYYQQKYIQNIVDISNIQDTLLEDEALIEYFYGDHNIYTWIIQSYHIHAYRIPLAEDFALPFQRFIVDVKNRDKVVEHSNSISFFQQFVSDITILSDNLLGGVFEQFPTSITIIPDGPLAYLPFEILFTRAVQKDTPIDYASLPYLLKTANIRYEYSAFLWQSPQKLSPKARVLGGFAPIYDNDLIANSSEAQVTCDAESTTEFIPLNNIQAEVNSIIEIIDGKQYLGQDANEEIFKTKAGNFQILHLAMHGFLNECDPAYSGLAFTQPEYIQDDSLENDGFLHAYEIYNMKFDTELAVLSACNTGQGNLEKGEGVMSLARAFKYAGCPNIIMSLWQADDNATAQVMEFFYQNIKDQLGKDKALRQAKLDYLQSYTRNHPFYWAGFVLIGDNKSVDISHTGMSTIYINVLLLIITALIIWLLFRRQKK